MLRKTMHYDADPATVYAMLTDQAFQEKAMAATHAFDHEVEIVDLDTSGAPGASRRVTTRRSLPTTSAPDAVRRFVGGSVVVAQVVEWGAAGADGSREGRTHADIEGVPAEASGTMHLRPADGGTDHVVDLTLTSRVPLVGGRIVAAAEPLVGEALEAEHRVGARHLAERG
ncbi:DUF2505 domain-containing protein [Mobilicoccus pelagius]|uniref:DUF2505 domain-containing protein n=1 Tax=Mobilicoccus pelagius NBRC 104925 TaxID=1089455 RepID=H5URX4_9MICO|nr:DUF2505 domain-containing protein [Mobilicoccus pelagius]GAB48482.1 hypothetical protein MOPEL_073_01230 [Mobilicoccus pelagius NBRC 104925]